MGETTATVAETRANFSKIAATVNVTGRPVTVFKELEVLGARGSRGEGLQGPHPQHRLVQAGRREHGHGEPQDRAAGRVGRPSRRRALR